MRARSPQGRTVHLLQIALPRIAVVAASLAALGLGATSSLAAGGVNSPVSGIVIGITADSMEVQSATGPVTVAITEQTRVIRTVSGTVADMRRGQ